MDELRAEMTAAPGAVTRADGQWPGYCPAHVEACERWGLDFGPFPGCPDCQKPAGFDLKTQPHLAIAASEPTR